jgi:toxin ParE1/3/4
MKRLEVLYGPDAPLDIGLLEEWLALNGAGLLTIERYVARLRERCERIGALPFGGRARDDLLPGLRTVIFESRILIAYRVNADHVEILNIFSHGRDYEAFYDDGDEQG